MAPRPAALDRPDPRHDQARANGGERRRRLAREHGRRSAGDRGRAADCPRRAISRERAADDRPLDRSFDAVLRGESGMMLTFDPSRYAPVRGVRASPGRHPRAASYRVRCGHPGSRLVPDRRRPCCRDVDGRVRARHQARESSCDGLGRGHVPRCRCGGARVLPPVLGAPPRSRLAARATRDRSRAAPSRRSAGDASH
jgi:hypothetical protein